MELELAKKLWNYMRLNDEIVKSDCILGLGCHDLNIPRVCADLYHKGLGDIIIFSGGLGKGTKDEFKKSEAEVFCDIAVQLGVPREKIYLETESTNTGDNFKFTAQLITDQNLKIDSFILVHKPYMERRSYAAFMANIKNKKCLVTSEDISFEDYMARQSPKEQEQTINILAGDVQRMKIYAEKGWQIEQEIPDDIWEAMLELYRLGYNKYEIK